MGGKNSSKGSDAMIREQRAQADEARQKEFARQERLTRGVEGIRQAFHGAPVQGQRAANFDWTSLIPDTAQGRAQATAKGLPAGFSFVNVGGGGGGGGVNAMPPPQARAPTGQVATRQKYVGGHDASQPQGFRQEYAGHDKSGSPLISSFGQFAQLVNPTAAGGGDQWAVRGPDGRIYRRGEAIPYQETYDTGQRSGGFGEDFFNKFRQGILDYYNPQVAQKFGEAKDETTYRLARAGTGRSSMSIEEMAKLDEQNRLNKANVQLQADTGAADLRKRVADEESKAESQLYATENPDVATNQALAAVRNLSLAQPELNPLGDIFKVALVGGANALSGYRNQSTLNSIPGYRKGGTNVVNA